MMKRSSFNLLDICPDCNYELAAYFVPVDQSDESENYLLVKRVPGEWKVACQNPACDYVWQGACKNINELKSHGFNVEDK